MVGISIEPDVEEEPNEDTPSPSEVLADFVEDGEISSFDILEILRPETSRIFNISIKEYRDQNTRRSVADLEDPFCFLHRDLLIPRPHKRRYL